MLLLFIFFAPMIPFSGLLFSSNICRIITLNSPLSAFTPGSSSPSQPRCSCLNGQSCPGTRYSCVRTEVGHGAVRCRNRTPQTFLAGGGFLQNKPCRSPSVFCYVDLRLDCATRVVISSHIQIVPLFCRFQGEHR